MENLIFVGPFGFHIMSVANFFFLLAVGAVILPRLNRVSRAEARTAAEMEAAREIQRTLVPLELPAIEECEIAAAYLPTEQVGGDFYQVLPPADGPALVAAGDVSGKGLKTAMTGFVAIGTLRALAPTGVGTGPGKLLDAMNKQMLAAQQGGFVTIGRSNLASRKSPELLYAQPTVSYPY